MTNTGQELEQLMTLLSSQEWRIFSGKIYSIKDKHWKKIPFIPNAFQKDFFQRRHTKNIILKARQLGFSTLIDIMSLDKVLFSKYKSVGIIADDRDSAELIFRDKVKFAFDNLPEWLSNTFQVKTDRKGELVFENNHCSIAVDTSFRWGTLQMLHISEYGKICNKYPDKAREIQTGALNTVAPESEVFIESTAEWNSGYFYDMAMRAMANEEMGKVLSPLDYKFFFYPWFLDTTYELTDDFAITQETYDYFWELKRNEYIQKNYPDLKFGPEKMRWYQKKKEEQGDDMAREYPSFPKEAFDIAIKWAYYEKELSIAREQKRITTVYHDERLPVYTAWDLWGSGWWDDTAIWFYQIYGKEVRLIDYWDGSWYSMIEIANTIVNPRYKLYDTHYLPHDGNVHEYSTGVTRLITARQHLKGRVETVPMYKISEGINNVRNMFPHCYFDEAKCSKWLSVLQKYRRKYDEKNGIFMDKPDHTESHGCDALRYLATVYQDMVNPKTEEVFEQDWSNYL